MTSGARRVHPAMVLVATGLGLFMIFLDATIVNVALPAIQADFGVGESGLQWVVAAYSLTMGMFMMTSASIADRAGRRRAFVVGIGDLLRGLAGLWPGAQHRRAQRHPGGAGRRRRGGQRGLAGARGCRLPGPAGEDQGRGAVDRHRRGGPGHRTHRGRRAHRGLGWRSVFLVNPIVGVVAVVLTLRLRRRVGRPRRPQLRSRRPAAVHRGRRRGHVRARPGARCTARLPGDRGHVVAVVVVLVAFVLVRAALAATR